MKQLKTYENFNDSNDYELMIQIPELLDTKYWYIMRPEVNPNAPRVTLFPVRKESEIIYWKVEKISDNEYSIFNLNSNKIRHSNLDLNLLKILLKHGKNASVQFRPLTKEEIEDFEIKIQATQYNL